MYNPVEQFEIIPIFLLKISSLTYVTIYFFVIVTFSFLNNKFNKIELKSIDVFFFFLFLFCSSIHLYVYLEYSQGNSIINHIIVHKHKFIQIFQNKLMEYDLNLVFLIYTFSVFFIIGLLMTCFLKLKKSKLDFQLPDQVISCLFFISLSNLILRILFIRLDFIYLIIIWCLIITVIIHFNINITK